MSNTNLAVILAFVAGSINGWAACQPKWRPLAALITIGSAVICGLSIGG